MAKLNKEELHKLLAEVVLARMTLGKLYVAVKGPNSEEINTHHIADIAVTGCYGKVEVKDAPTITFRLTNDVIILALYMDMGGIIVPISISNAPVSIFGGNDVNLSINDTLLELTYE